jgi:DNA primase
MKISEAKNIPIEYVLQKQNYYPTKNYNNKLWYATSISRPEKETKASLVVDTSKNRFADYGLGVNGDTIDLIKLIYRVEIKEAIKILSDLFPNYNFSSFKGNGIIKEKSTIKITDVTSVSHIALIDYLKQRSIPLELGKKYCKQIHYVNKNKVFFSLGFKNDDGGWELRSVGFKACFGNKRITTILGNEKQLNVFEGFFDFLSALKYFKTTRLKFKTIVLNSTSNFRYIEKSLANYDKINLFIDNDDSGKKLKEKIRKVNPHSNDVGMQLYPNYNDFNDFLISKTKGV